MFTFKTKKSILKALITKKKSPYYVQYYINSVCNLKCKQCNIVESNSDVEELELEGVEKVAQNLADIGGGIVLLTGGEPFMRKDIHRFVEIFHRYDLNVRLQTAGIATDEQLQNCYDAGARDLNISLDSLDPNKQDYINSVPGSWEKAIDAISRVSKIFKGESAIVSLGCVLSKFNYMEIPSILEFATKIGWQLSLVPVHITSPNMPKGFRSYEADFVFEDKDFIELEKTIKKIIKMKKEGYLLFDSEKFLWSSFQFLKDGTSTWRKNGVCDSPDLYFGVRPNGDFTTCCDYKLENTYSLADPDFPNRYRNGDIHKISSDIVNSCSGCHYGSYPEVTLSVRDKKALFERIRLVLFEKSKQIEDLSREDYFQIINEIKANNPESYSNDVLKGTIFEKLQKWREPQTRKDLIRLDNQKRIAENRRRGKKQGDSIGLKKVD